MRQPPNTATRLADAWEAFLYEHFQRLGRPPRYLNTGFCVLVPLDWVASLPQQRYNPVSHGHNTLTGPAARASVSAYPKTEGRLELQYVSNSISFECGHAATQTCLASHKAPAADGHGLVQ